ncbi:MAG: hypothetical protein Q9207_007347 [Kuettlingeria erythrocarpa]
MAEQKRPTSNIPRLSRLPVRTSIVGVPRPAHSAGDPRTIVGDLGSLKVSRSRPTQQQSNAQEQLQEPTDQFTKPSAKSAAVKGGVAAAKKRLPEGTVNGQKEQAGDKIAEDEASQLPTRRPRPSLADRAIESLSQIPPSPSPRRRQSGFFPPDSPAVRAPSALGRSRPATSAAFYPPLPTSRPTSPTKHPVPRPNQTLAPVPRKAPITTRPASDMSSKAKAPMGRVIRDEIHRDKDTPVKQHAFTTVSSKPTLRSSAALRETIANAKAARRTAPKPTTDGVVKPINRYLDLPAPPEETGVHENLLRKRINIARTEGKLNISGMGFKAFPDEVFKMYAPENMTDGPTWYESVDLVRLDASNNELDDLGWDSVVNDENGDRGCDNVFGRLQTLNLHGNRLRTLPLALQGLENLAVLNLSRNNLGQSMCEIFEIISSISSLRELQIADNHLSGPLPPFSQCTNLEILDLHANAITSLPQQLAECRKLRRLDISSNRITKVPSLDLPDLINFNISSNQIDVDNFIMNLTAPRLTDLDMSVCRVNHLPALRSKLPSLTTLIAFDNSIFNLNDVESLRGIEVLDLRNNDLRSLPAELSLLGLKRFTVSGNPMRAPRREILEGTTERLMDWLKSRLPAGTLDEETF